MTLLSLSTYWLKRAILFSYSAILVLLKLPTYCNCFCKASFSLQVILSSFVNFPIWEAESLKFSWAFLTSSPRLVFYAKSFWIFCLKVYDYWLLDWSWVLYWLISELSFDVWAADNLKFYWAYWISPPKALISLFFLSMTPFSLSNYWLKRAILF